MTRKYKQIYCQPAPPGFEGFSHQIWSNGRNCIFGYVDEHDGDAGFVKNMTDLWKWNDMFHFRLGKNNRNLKKFIRQVSGQEYPDWTKLDIPSSEILNSYRHKSKIQ